MSDEKNEIQVILAEPENIRLALRASDIVARFEELVGKGNAMPYISSVMIAVSSSEDLQKCELSSIIGSALRAATLRLSVDPAIAHAYLVPFRDNKAGGILKAQFITGYKGYMHMCIRTGKYKFLHLVDIYADDVVTENPVTGEITLKRGSVSLVAQHNAKIGIAPIGHLLYIELKTGYRAWCFMTAEECEAHGQKYSKSYYNRDGSINRQSKWYTDPVAMHRKTVVRRGITWYGDLEPEDANMLNNYDDTGEDDNEDYLRGIDLAEVKPTAAQSLAELGQPIDQTATAVPAAEKTTPAEAAPVSGAMTFEEAATVLNEKGKMYIAMSDKDLGDVEKNIGETLKGELSAEMQNAWLLRLEAVHIILAKRRQNGAAEQLPIEGA